MAVEKKNWKNRGKQKRERRGVRGGEVIDDEREELLSLLQVQKVEENLTRNNEWKGKNSSTFNLRQFLSQLHLNILLLVGAK